ncbi:MAG: hypothetical protein LBR06_08915 [Bacteroidales bacterium]|jgi:hypothetical protein|nr:hypothetical protein [Bacteroidales bacterium]
MESNGLNYCVSAVVCGALALPLLTACNKDEGLGGSSSLEGMVYNVIHYDDDFSYSTDTVPAGKTDVYLVFGDDEDAYFGDDIETDKNGYYRFDYLRKGNYVVYAYSDLPDGRRQAVTQNVRVGSGTGTAAPLYIHSGKAYGTAIIKGYVEATYYHNGVYRDFGTGTGMRAYIRRAGVEGFFDDARVSDGIFVFQKLTPGEYEIAIESEDPDTEKITLIYTAPIKITDTEKIYVIEGVISVTVSV